MYKQLGVIKNKFIKTASIQSLGSFFKYKNNYLPFWNPQYLQKNITFSHLKNREIYLLGHRTNKAQIKFLIFD
jgi:hypothetical protein